VQAGFAPKLASQLARFAAVVKVLGALSLSLRSGAPWLDTIALHSGVGRITGITQLLEYLTGARRGDGWSRIAAEALRIEMLEVQRHLTERLLDSAEGSGALEEFRAAKAACLREVEATIERIDAGGDRSLASLTVLSQQIRRLC